MSHTNTTFHLFILFCLAIGFINCGDADFVYKLGEPPVTEEPVDADPKPLTFTTIQKDILIPKCAGCHSPPRPRAQFDVTSFESVAKRTTSTCATKTLLYQLITTTNSDDVMPPPSRPPLTESEIKAIRKWISHGAPAEGEGVEPDTDPCLESP